MPSRYDTKGCHVNPEPVRILSTWNCPENNKTQYDKTRWKLNRDRIKNAVKLIKQRRRPRAREKINSAEKEARRKANKIIN